MQNFSRRTLTKAFGASIVGAGTLGLNLARAADPVTWNLYTYYPVATGMPVRGLMRIANEMEKSSDGAFKIKVHMGGSLPIQAASITPAVQNNVVQIAADIFSVGNVPIVGGLRLPTLIHNVSEFEHANKIMLPYILAAYEKKGMMVLGRYVYPLQTLWSRNKLTSLAELKGQKIRVSSPEQGEFVKRMGGTALTMGTADVAAALDRGVVEGVVTAASGGGYVWRDLLKYNLMFPVCYMESLVIVNKAAFDALPEAQRKALRDSVSTATAWMTEQLGTEENELRTKMQATGLVVSEVKPAEIQEGQTKMVAYWDEWTKAQAPDGVESMRKMRQMLGR